MFNVLIGEFKLETNSFLKEPTTLQDYKNRNLVIGKDVIPHFENVRNEIGGFISYLKKQDDINIIPSIAANATPGGKATREVFEFVKGHIINAYKSSERVDGILLSLHGAMVTEDHQDGDGVLLEEIRKVTGPDIPIFITLDLHVNISEKMIKNANAFFLFDNYPHTDTYDRGLEAAEAMCRTLRGEIKPVMACKKIPVLSAGIPTVTPPMSYILARAHEHEKDPKVITASIAQGFYFADVEEMQMAVCAVTDNDIEYARYIADDLAGLVYKNHKEFGMKLVQVDDAVMRAMNAPEGPVILADISDNPGGGAGGDGTFILQSLIRHNAVNAVVGTIYDPETVQQALKAGVGSVIHVRLGGKSCDGLTGDPVETDAYVKSITDGVYYFKGPMAHGFRNEIGPTVVLVIGGIEVIVGSVRHQPWDLEIYRANGIEPTEKQIIVVKSSTHFRASYGPIAKDIIYVDLPGMTSKNPRQFKFKNLVRPVYPFDEI
jgi:microcystin degradation protein MlrC